VQNAVGTVNKPFYAVVFRGAPHGLTKDEPSGVPMVRDGAQKPIATARIGPRLTAG
jgi:hypothetical protein